MFCWETSLRAFHAADSAPMTNSDRPRPASDAKASDSAASDSVAPDVTAPVAPVPDKKDQPHHDLDADALMALDQARKLKPGPKRAAAMKRAGNLRYAADSRGLSFPKRGRPKKT